MISLIDFNRKFRENEFLIDNFEGFLVKRNVESNYTKDFWMKSMLVYDLWKFYKKIAKLSNILP